MESTLGPYKDIEFSSTVGGYLRGSPTHSQRECLKNFLVESQHTSVPREKYKDVGSEVFAATVCDHVMTVFVRKDRKGNQYWRVYDLRATDDDPCSV